MSVVVFIVAVIIGSYLYDLYKRDLRNVEKDGHSSRSSSIDEESTWNGNSYFRAFLRTLNNNYQDPHALIHEKPSPFQFRAFDDRFKSLEDVTAAIREAGLEQCRLVLGIDFTASNEFQGRSTYKGHSLHHVSSRPHIQNPYQHVISILSRTLNSLMIPNGLEPIGNGTAASFRNKKLVQHDLEPAGLRSSFRRKKPGHHDLEPFAAGSSFRGKKTVQCIHAYGFGDSITKDKSTFPLNPSYLPCSSFDDVQRYYKETLDKVVLDGPTSYAPIINKAIEIVEESNKKFYILIIIADGQFVDEGPTAEAIVKASNHPLSIVVVGVGDGPWNMLKRFDDWLPQRKFDNFQFVDYNKVIKEFGGKHAETAIALHTLMEIPDQFKTVQELGFLERPLTDTFQNDYTTEVLDYVKKSK